MKLRKNTESVKGHIKVKWRYDVWRKLTVSKNSEYLEQREVFTSLFRKKTKHKAGHPQRNKNPSNKGCNALSKISRFWVKIIFNLDFSVQQNYQASINVECRSFQISSKRKKKKRWSLGSNPFNPRVYQSRVPGWQLGCTDREQLLITGAGENIALGRRYPCRDSSGKGFHRYITALDSLGNMRMWSRKTLQERKQTTRKRKPYRTEIQSHYITWLQEWATFVESSLPRYYLLI